MSKLETKKKRRNKKGEKKGIMREERERKKRQFEYMQVDYRRDGSRVLCTRRLLISG